MGNLSQKNIITSWNDRYSVCRGQPYYELKSWRLQVVCPVATEMPSAVVDPDLELRGWGVGGGGGVLFCFRGRLFFRL